VKLFLGDQAHPAVARLIGEYRPNKKPTAFNKSDKEACERALLSTLLSFHQRAQVDGALPVPRWPASRSRAPSSS